MRFSRVSLSPPRRFLIDLLAFARRLPTVPVQRQFNIEAVVIARLASTSRPGWPALFLKAFALVADEMPSLRRAYVSLPWPRLAEYPHSVASIAVERDHQGELAVFFGKIGDPSHLALTEIHRRIRAFADAPIETFKPFRKLLFMGKLPGPIRRALLWLGLNIARTRPGQFGTFGLSVYSSLGAESLHPLSPLTVTMNYGVIDAAGNVSVRLIYDHRVLDGATVARALTRIEETLKTTILNELLAASRAVAA